ncbi:MAG: PAS domain S-box protein [Desulfobacterium sp.]|nr:PAS domain S-box protein [Desulfobacterium sp.]
MFTLFVFVFVFVLCAEQGLNAQNGFEFETGLKGLPSQKEGNMLRDQEGFLWFCYYGGIGRYDGHGVKYYKPGKNSISGPAPLSIVMDADGVLWILTKDNGLNKYDKDTDTFTHYTHDPTNTNSISSDISDSFCPQRLFVDTQNRLLIGTMGGFDIYDKKQDRFQHYVHDPGNPNSLSSNNVTSIIQGKDGLIWIGTSGGGLNRFDETTNTWTRYRYEAGSDTGIASDTVWSLLEDKEGTLWVGTWDRGLSRFNKETETFSQYRHDPNDPASLGDNKIYYLYGDAAGNIWICHRGSTVAGIEMLNPERTEFVRFFADPEKPSSISSNYVSTVYEDPVTGIFWVMNVLDGVIDKYDMESRKFALYRHTPSNPDSISSSQVLVMLEDKKERLWLSVIGGLEIYDPGTGKFSHLPYGSMDPRMGPTTTAMCWDDDDMMWLLNSRGGLTQFDTRSLTPVNHYSHDPDDPDTIMVSTTLGGHVIKDRNDPDLLWIGLSAGLEKFNKKTGKFTHFIHDAKDPGSITQGTVWSVYDDGKGVLWVSTFGGLNRFDKQTETFTRFVHNPDDPDSIGFNKQSGVFEDSFGHLWVAGFSNGMDLLDRETGVFKHFNKGNGFPALGINLTIQEDRDGYLWIGTTDNGLIKFNIKNQKVDSVFSKGDGLQDDHFWRSCKKRDGEMWFGGGFGVNSFYPDKVTKNTAIPPVVLTSFTQGGSDVNMGKAPERMKQVTLGWKENFFEFRFAALNYTNSEKNRYAYMLQGRDKEWYYSDHNPSGRYTGLGGGTYTLRLKGSNNDGVWNEEGASLKITIVPPFWKTGWFYSVMVCGILFAIGCTMMYLKKLKFEIRERKSAEAALGQSEEKYRILIENAPDLRYRTDMEGNLIFVSQSVHKLSGYTVEEAIGMRMAEELYVEPKDRDVFLTVLEEKGSVDNYEAPLKRKDGSIWWASTNAHFFKDHDGRILGVEGVTRDVTEGKLAGQELNHLRNYLTNIIDSMPSVLVGVDTAGNVTQWNKTAEKATGVSVSTAQGKKLSHVFPRMASQMAKITESIRTRETRQEQKRPRLSENGPCYEDVTIYPLVANGVEGAVIRIDDVTEQVRMEEMMVQSEKMLSVGGLAAGMAHEINNPLAGMIQTANVMANRLTNIEIPANQSAAMEVGTDIETIKAFMEKRGVLRMVETINASGRRVAEIVDNMLSFARKSDARVSSHDLADLLDKTLNLAATDYDLKKHYDFRQIEIREEYEAGLPMVPCEGAKIQQVLLNILSNGAQAMQENMEKKNGSNPIFILRLSRETATNMMRLEIEDNGPGMDEATQKRVFEPFFTTKPVGIGTGLGLSVSYFIITENHGGTMDVISEPGKGATFIIRLPLDRQWT